MKAFTSGRRIVWHAWQTREGPGATPTASAPWQRWPMNCKKCIPSAFLVFHKRAFPGVAHLALSLQHGSVGLGPVLLQVVRVGLRLALGAVHEYLGIHLPLYFLGGRGGIKDMEVCQEMERLRDEEGLSERQIARRLELAPSKVHYWLAKADARGAGVDSPRRGRPRVTTPAQDVHLYQWSQLNPFSSAVALRDEMEMTISADTVRRRLKEHGLRCRVPARKPFLKEEHLEKRLRFAWDHFHWGVEEWQSVVFSDEKIFRASSRGPLRVYRPSWSDRFEQKYIAPSTNPKGTFTINVWVAFGAHNFREIHRVTARTLDAVYYTQHILPIVEEHVCENDLVYMHDLASVHTSRLTKAWLEFRNVEVMEDWPPKGPDMNPVENLWAELVRRTRNDPSNRRQLWENVQTTFNDLPVTYFDKLMASMPKRMKGVIEARGGWTKY